MIFRSRPPLCVWKLQSEIREPLCLVSGGEMWKGRVPWPVNHAAGVRGLLYSCHCAQQQMQRTRRRVSNAVRLTCGPQLKDTVEFVSSLLLKPGRIRESGCVFCPEKASERSCRHSFCSKVVVSVQKYPPPSSSSTVTSGLQMRFTRNVFPATSLPVKATAEVLDLNESPEQARSVFPSRSVF